MESNLTFEDGGVLSCHQAVTGLLQCEERERLCPKPLPSSGHRLVIYGTLTTVFALTGPADELPLTIRVAGPGGT